MQDENVQKRYPLVGKCKFQKLYALYIESESKRERRDK